MKQKAFNRLSVRRPHLILIGAGASRAAFPNGDKNGRIPPLMNDFFDVVEGLSDYLKKHGIDYQGQNFEDLYSSLFEDSKYDEIRNSIETIIYDYFVFMELPDEPNLYDHLVLSLTSRDAIATFNWDPFLWQAMCRNYNRVGGNDNLPYSIFLHGNTAIGVCTKHKKITISDKRKNCPQCYSILQESKLLYPIKKKNYNIDPFIKSSWKVIKMCLEEAFMFTIFGYSAPSSDVEAVNLLGKGWGDKYQRNMEQIEVIDILDEDSLRKRWGGFIHTHHYATYKDFYSSSIAKYGRRSVDTRFNQFINIIYPLENPIPKDATWEELDKWLKPLLEEEKSVKNL
jgi:hypothetical protein